VVPVLPHDSLLIKLLRSKRVFVGGSGIIPGALNTNLGAFEGPFVDIGNGSRGDRSGTGDKASA
jgi:hypothetical protein